MLWGCLPYTSVTLVVIETTDINADMLKIAESLKRIGFTESPVSHLAPKGSVGFRAYANQFTVLHPEPEKNSISISFGEGSDKFSSRAAGVYREMVNALRAQFGSSRIVGPGILNVDSSPNHTLNTDRPTASLLGSLRAARSGGRLA